MFMCNVIVDVLWPAEAQTMANMKHLHLLTATYLIHGSQEYFEHRKNVQLVALPRLFWEKHIWNYVSYNSSPIFEWLGLYAKISSQCVIADPEDRC